MHYQPERTTAPDPGAWVDVHRIADRCLAATPDHMSLFICEHPAQFHTFRLEHLLRRPGFYRELVVADPRVVAGMHGNPFELLDGSSGIVTATWNMGWEAIARAKYVLCSPGACFLALPRPHCFDADAGVRSFVDVASGSDEPAGWDDVLRSPAGLASRALPPAVDRARDDRAESEARLLTEVVAYCIGGPSAASDGVPGGR